MKTTTMKDRLEDKSIARWIQPDLLDPFRQNPYTQPLESFFILTFNFMHILIFFNNIR